MRKAQCASQPSIECTRVKRTDWRPGSEGTYIVRISTANARQLKVWNGAYLKIRYGEAWVTARLSIDHDLDEETIRVDQTLRTALYLEKVMQGSGKKELVYRSGKKTDLEYPIVVQRSQFRGPSLLARLVKQQYLVCNVHTAMAEDMEKPIVRLLEDSMKIIGINPGDKVLLISEKRRKRVRCLTLDPDKYKRLPSKTLKTKWPKSDIHALSSDPLLNLPWITMDHQMRLDLDVQPWQPIIVGRDPRHAVSSEFTTVAMAVALSALGGAVTVPESIEEKVAWIGWWILFVGLAIVATLITLKIRTRI